VLHLSEAGLQGEQHISDDALGVAPRGGTLIVAPLSVLDAVWARELASKVEKKRKERTMPFRVNLMRSQVLYRAALDTQGSYR